MTLLIMAAGIGSRYGGLKQMDPVGEHNELIIDYSVFDAVKAGFTKVVFVIRRDIEEIFCDKFFNRIKQQIDARYVFQDIPKWRKKPLGTTSAIMAAKDIIDGPFCVINADDYYGRDAFMQIADFFKNSTDKQAMVAYKLCNTVSDFGTVSRGILSLDGNSNIVDIKEQIVIERNGNIVFMQNGAFIIAEPKLNASMNFFAFTPKIFELLEPIYAEFLDTIGEDMSKECFLPENVGRLIQEGKLSMRVLETQDKWMGVTYPPDKPDVVGKIKKMIDDGFYPSPLWK